MPRGRHTDQRSFHDKTALARPCRPTPRLDRDRQPRQTVPARQSGPTPRLVRPRTRQHIRPCGPARRQKQYSAYPASRPAVGIRLHGPAPVPAGAALPGGGGGGSLDVPTPEMPVRYLNALRFRSVPDLLTAQNTAARPGEDGGKSCRVSGPAVPLLQAKKQPLTPLPGRAPHLPDREHGEPPFPAPCSHGFFPQSIRRRAAGRAFPCAAQSGRLPSGSLPPPQRSDFSPPPGAVRFQPGGSMAGFVLTR